MIDFREYLTYSKIEELLFGFEEKYPNMMKLSSLCETEGGRKVYLAKITDNINSEDYDKKVQNAKKIFTMKKPHHSLYTNTASGSSKLRFDSVYSF